MNLFVLLVELLVAGVALWALNTFVPMQQGIKTLINVVVVLVMVVIVLNAFGILHALKQTMVPKVACMTVVDGGTEYCSTENGDAYEVGTWGLNNFGTGVYDGFSSCYMDCIRFSPGDAHYSAARNDGLSACATISDVSLQPTDWHVTVDCDVPIQESSPPGHDVKPRADDALFEFIGFYRTTTPEIIKASALHW